MCRDHHHHHPELFQDNNWIHDEKDHPCPRWLVLSSTTLLPSLQHKLVRVLCYTLSSLLSSICSSVPWIISIFYVKNVMRITPPLKNSWYSDTSHHHHSILVPMLIPTSERCCLDSFLLATLFFLKLMVGSSFLVYWLLNHHSDIGRATQPIFRAHLSTNV